MNNAPSSQPRLLPKMRKHLCYLPENIYASPQDRMAYLQLQHEINHGPGEIEALCKLIHHDKGVQMQVSKQVSDLLMDTDFDGSVSFEKIDFPAPSVEVFFDDPALPTILLVKADAQDFASVMVASGLPPNAGFEHDELVFMAEMEGRDDHGEIQSYSLSLTPEMWTKIMLDRQELPMKNADPVQRMDKDEAQCLDWMVRMGLKVLAYCMVDAACSEPIRHRSEMKTGGKSGIKNRPDRPARRVIYLPRFSRAGFSEPNPPQGSTHASPVAHFRRCHFRYLKADYFVNKKGQMIFVRPSMVHGRAAPAVETPQDRPLYRVRTP